jgi:probable biosynthetic protein (TIGR04098 family)
MSAPWHDYHFTVQMPHMAPGEKLSEVEMLKMLAAHQWESIARALQRRPSKIVNDKQERLYGSVIDVEFHLGRHHSLEVLGEDAEVHVRNQVRFFAKKFVEGLFLIDDKPIPDSTVDAIKSRDDLRGLDISWACMTNAFIARAGGNVRLKVFKPEGADDGEVPELRRPPLGITEQGLVQRTGEIELPGTDPDPIPLRPAIPGPVTYTIVPESDLNGAGLVYFARYEAMMNYGERVFLRERLERPLSSDLIACLSTEHRRAYFFANASAADTVDVHLSVGLIPGDREPHPPAAAGYRCPFKLVFRIDLYRNSDKMLMATSLVRKGLNVPGNMKAVLAEAERLTRQLG